MIIPITPKSPNHIYELGNPLDSAIFLQIHTNNAHIPTTIAIQTKNIKKITAIFII